VNDIVFQGDTKQPILKLMHGNESSKRALLQALFVFKELHGFTDMKLVSNSSELEDSTQDYCKRIDRLNPSNYERQQDYYKSVTELFTDLQYGGSLPVIHNGLHKGTDIFNQLREAPALSFLNEILEKIEDSKHQKQRAVFYHTIGLVATVASLVALGIARNNETYFDSLAKFCGGLCIINVFTGLNIYTYNQRIKRLKSRQLSAMNEARERVKAFGEHSQAEFAAFDSVATFLDTWKWAKTEPIS